MLLALGKLMREKEKKAGHSKDAAGLSSVMRQNPKKNDEKFTSAEYFILLLSK